ncbi:MAG: hypothetical protein WDN31_16550 [Hyphomicrobium sp.]
MTKLPAASAAAILLCLFSIPDARAGCDEDCVYEAHEAAYEQASERAYAREEAAEEGYVLNTGRGEGSSRKEKRAASPKDLDPAEARSAPAAKRVTEPRPAPAPASETPRARTKVASENSSITTGTTQLAEDDVSPRTALQREGRLQDVLPFGRHDDLGALRLGASYATGDSPARRRPPVA